MFILDSLMISGLRWVLDTVHTAADAELNDDTALREQLLDAEMRREMGEITGDDFAALEADILARIREIKERREGGSGPLSMGEQPIETTGDNRFQIEATVSGDFHEPAGAPHTTIIETEPAHSSFANLVETQGGEQIAVLDMEPGDANPRLRVAPEKKRNATAGPRRSSPPKAAGERRRAARRKLRKS